MADDATGEEEDKKPASWRAPRRLLPLLGRRLGLLGLGNDKPQPPEADAPAAAASEKPVYLSAQGSEQRSVTSAGFTQGDGQHFDHNHGDRPAVVIVNRGYGGYGHHHGNGYGYG